MRRDPYHAYHAPGKDSVRAMANARLFLARVRSFEHVTAEDLATRYNLKPATAERELADAKARRRA
jgi:hypothetical protein